MSSADWDVEQYRVQHECDEHWELRRHFLLTHKDKFPEDRLVCLAQVFYNVEFMGCRYPEETMRLVAELSKGVADDHREKMKSKLQRTFVQASDAASSKVKGRQTAETSAAQNKKGILFQKSQEPEPSSKQEYSPRMDLEKPDTSHNTQSIPGRFVLADQSRFQITNNESNSKKRTQGQQQTSSKKPKGDDVFSNIVLMESVGMAPYAILSRSLEAARMKLKVENIAHKNGKEVIISANDEVIAKGVGSTVVEGKSVCAAKALERLRQCCYTLIVKDRLAGSVVAKDNIDDKKVPDVPKVDDSKAARMMKMMGWAGGGLGKNQQGREEPVQVVEQIHRAGLGLAKGEAQFRKYATDMLHKYKASEATHDLVFAADFSKEERKTLHNIASRFGLKSVSYGKDADRQLVVSRKRTPWEIVEEVRNAGGSTAKYDLIDPTGA